MMINEDGYNYPDVSFPPYDSQTFGDGVTPHINEEKKEYLGLDKPKIPPYDDGTMKMEITDDDSSQCPDFKISQKDDDWYYEEAFQKSSCVDHKGSTLEEENLNIALINVLEMAKEYCTNNLVDSDKIIGDESIRKVQEFLGQMKNNFKSPEESNL